MSARRRPRPDLRVSVSCRVLAETGRAIVMRLERPSAGPDSHPVVVMVEPGVTAEHAAGELRALADELVADRLLRSAFHGDRPT